MREKTSDEDNMHCTMKLLEGQPVCMMAFIRDVKHYSEDFSFSLGAASLQLQGPGFNPELEALKIVLHGTEVLQEFRFAPNCLNMSVCALQGLVSQPACSPAPSYSFCIYSFDIERQGYDIITSNLPSFEEKKQYTS